MDVDTGTDDAGALLLAATWPDFEVVAATATWGNCSRDQAAANTLAVLGSSAFGASSGTGTIVYTDGSIQSFSLAFADWWSASAVSGTDIAATLSYINTGGGKSTQTVHMYYAAVPIQSSKTVQAVVLPNVSANAAQGVTAMHIFAMAIGSGTPTGG